MTTKKTETIEEFLARGGKITKISAVQEEETTSPVRSTKVAPATILSLEDGDFYYGKKNQRKKKIKEVSLSDEEKNVIANGNISDDLKKMLGI